MNRCNENPLITAGDVKPSRNNFTVEGIFNCGVCQYRGEILLLCRVSESAGIMEGHVKVPILTLKDEKYKIDVIDVKKSEHPEWDFSDSRSIVLHTVRGQRVMYLTSFSHLRLARSTDGIHFKVDDSPFILPDTYEESWGMEDPRITQIDDTYYINYTVVSPSGPATGLSSTTDFISYQKLGIIFAPENKDIVIFPQKIGRRYYALNRPASGDFGAPDMWICESQDLIHWGLQRHFCSPSGSGWEEGRIGAGAVPFKTEKGWMEIYHAADGENHYCLGAMLLDAEHPDRIIARTENPILTANALYEKDGFFSNTVFTCGCYQERDIDTVVIYYGAADDKICRADFTLDELYQALKV